MSNKRHPVYNSPWPRVRLAILNRDNHTCQIRSQRCTGTATQVDHIIPVLKGGAWYDPANLRATCAHCNNQRVDRQQDNRWQTAHTHITLILGPPGTDKTTYVNTHARPGDLVIDYDNIADALGGYLQNVGDQNGRPQNLGGTKKTGGTTPADTPRLRPDIINHQHKHLHEATMAARNAIINKLKRGDIKIDRGWIISSNPRGEEMFPYHKVVVIDPGQDKTLALAEADGMPHHFPQLVKDWYMVRSGKAPDGADNSRKW